MHVAEEKFGQDLPTVAGYGARLAIAALKKHNVAIECLTATGLHISRRTQVA